jgi:hypothetical protein
MTQPIDLSVATSAIATFKALPVYALLANFPQTLSVSQFVVSKENTNPLKGSADLFLSPVFEGDFTLPNLFVSPVRPIKPDPCTGAAQTAYRAAAARWLEDDSDFKDGQGAINDKITALARSLDTNDILRKYDNYRRCVSFLTSTLQADPSAFEVDDLLELNELPPAIKAKILAVYQQAFKINPVLLTMGSTVDLIAANPLCSLDSVDGINAIIKVQDGYKGAKYGFVSKELMIAVVKQVKSSLNAPTLVKLFDSLVSNGATSKNATTILNNLKKLF